MNVLRKYPIYTFITLFVVNVFLTVFLISILADGILKYKIGFVVNLPIIVSVPVVMVLTVLEYFRRKDRNQTKTIHLVIWMIVGWLNLLFYLFNLLLWIDLFDGKTNVMLP